MGIHTFVSDFEAIFGRKPDEEETAQTIGEQPVAQPAAVETKVVTAPEPTDVQPATEAEVK